MSDTNGNGNGKLVYLCALRNLHLNEELGVKLGRARDLISVLLSYADMNCVPVGQPIRIKQSELMRLIRTKRRETLYDIQKRCSDEGLLNIIRQGTAPSYVININALLGEDYSK
jgi:hypothetical protein